MHCSHLNQINPQIKPDSEGCEECMEMGESWVSLRLCLTCGHVGCCDSSKNKHATQHFQQTNHPIMKSVTPGEDLTWCYIDQVFLNQ